MPSVEDFRSFSLLTNCRQSLMRRDTTGKGNKMSNFRKAFTHLSPHKALDKITKIHYYKEN